MYDVITQRKMWATGWIPQWRLISWVLGLEVSDGSWGKVKQSFKSDLDKPVSFSSQQHSSGGRSTWLVHPQPAALWRSTAPTYTGTDRWNLTGMQSSQVSHFELTSLIGTWGPDFWIPMFWILRIFLDPNWQFFGRFPKQCGNTWGSYGKCKKPGWLDRGGGRGSVHNSSLFSWFRACMFVSSVNFRSFGVAAAGVNGFCL